MQVIDTTQRLRQRARLMTKTTDLVQHSAVSYVPITWKYQGLRILVHLIPM